MKVFQSCPTLWDPVGYTVHWMNSPGQNTGVGSLSLLWGNLPNSGIEPRSPALQADSLPAEPQWKSKNTRVGCLSLLQRIFPTQELNRGLLRWRQILYQLRHQGSLKNTGVVSYSFLQGIFPTQEWNPGLPSEPPGNHFETQCEALIKVIALLHISCFTGII